MHCRILDTLSAFIVRRVGEAEYPANASALAQLFWLPSLVSLNIDDLTTQLTSVSIYSIVFGCH